MNVANISSFSTYDLPVENGSSIISLCKAPFIRIWKICQCICNMILYPLKLIASLFQKPQAQAPIPSLSSPSLLSRLTTQCKQQAKTYSKQLTFATALSLASLVGMYFYKNVNVKAPDPRTFEFEKVIRGLLIGGGWTLVSVCVSYMFTCTPNPENTLHGRVAVPTTSTVIEPDTSTF